LAELPPSPPFESEISLMFPSVSIPCCLLEVLVNAWSNELIDICSIWGPDGEKGLSPKTPFELTIVSPFSYYYGGSWWLFLIAWKIDLEGFPTWSGPNWVGI
jgi:hypothetical protein